MGTAIPGYSGSILITSTPNVALTNEVLTDSGDHTTFNEATASKRYWDRTAAFTVQTTTNGGSTWSTAAANTYTIRYVTGQVVLNSALTGTPGCRISVGAYLPYSTFGQMKLWEAVLADDMLDNTSFSGFGGSHFKTYQPALSGADFKADQFYVDSTFFSILNLGTLFVFSGNTGRTAGERYEGYARLKGDDIKTAVNALIEENLTMVLDGQLYYFAS